MSKVKVVLTNGSEEFISESLAKMVKKKITEKPEKFISFGFYKGKVLKHISMAEVKSIG